MGPAMLDVGWLPADWTIGEGLADRLPRDHETAFLARLLDLPLTGDQEEPSGDGV